MEKLELIINKLLSYKKRNYIYFLDCDFSSFERSVLCNEIKNNELIRDYITNLQRETRYYSKTKRNDIYEKSLPLLILFNDDPKGADCFMLVHANDPERELNIERSLSNFLWTIEGLNGILRVLKVIRKHYKENLINNLVPSLA